MIHVCIPIAYDIFQPGGALFGISSCGGGLTPEEGGGVLKCGGRLCGSGWRVVGVAADGFVERLWLL